MAEAAQAPPTFKLVLVGDGGTGKVSYRPSRLFRLYLCLWHRLRLLQPLRQALLTSILDDLRQETFDR